MRRLVFDAPDKSAQRRGSLPRPFEKFGGAERFEASFGIEVYLGAVGGLFLVTIGTNRLCFFLGREPKLLSFYLAFFCHFAPNPVRFTVVRGRHLLPLKPDRFRFRHTLLDRSG